MECLECQSPIFPSRLRHHPGLRFCSRGCARRARALPLADRLARLTDRQDDHWLWLGNRERVWGYGRISVDGKPWLAHRAAWAVASGEDPGDQAVLHTCDMPACVRNDDAGVYILDGITLPRFGHLFLGTREHNVKDMIAKNRQAKDRRFVRGSQVGTAILSEEDARAILAMHATKRWRQTEIARFFGTTQANVSDIIRRRSWKHL